MSKIINLKDAIKISKSIKNEGESIVLAGGFFDILHPGHIKFLENAKKHGDYLFILLENDNKAKEIKGPKRPINSQKDRAKILSFLPSVDYIFLLSDMTNNNYYDKIILQLKPDIIATTDKDPFINHKERQAKLVNGKVVSVIKRISDHSTTKLVNLMSKNKNI